MCGIRLLILKNTVNWKCFTYATFVWDIWRAHSSPNDTRLENMDTAHGLVISNIGHLLGQMSNETSTWWWDLSWWNTFSLWSGWSKEQGERDASFLWLGNKLTGGCDIDLLSKPMLIGEDVFGPQDIVLWCWALFVLHSHGNRCTRMPFCGLLFKGRWWFGRRDGGYSIAMSTMETKDTDKQKHRKNNRCWITICHALWPCRLIKGKDMVNFSLTSVSVIGIVARKANSW